MDWIRMLRTEILNFILVNIQVLFNKQSIAHKID